VSSDDYVGVLLGFKLPKPIVVGADEKLTQGELDGAGTAFSSLLVGKTTSLSK